MYFTPLASGGGPATYFFVSRSLGGGTEALFLIFPHWDLSRTRLVIDATAHDVKQLAGDSLLATLIVLEI